MTRGPLGLLALTATAAFGSCSSGRPVPRPPSSVPVPPPSVPRPPSSDSLVLTTPDGYQIWLAEGRDALGAGGRCHERSVEIRRGSTITKVPLLFTNRPIVALKTGFVKAELMRDCGVIAEYRIELATGRPTKLADR